MPWRPAGGAGGRDFGAAVFANKMWAVGGEADSSVWCSADGITWNQATPDAGTNGYAVQAVSWNGFLWAIAGDRVRKSADGITWSNVVASPAPWNFLWGFRSVVFNSKLWILGGRRAGVDTNQVWSSPDGIAWTKLTPGTIWGPRQWHAAFVFDGKLWVAGGTKLGTLTGSIYTATRYNDLWQTTDGITWTQAQPSAAWSKRFGHAIVLWDTQLWLTGGHDFNYNGVYNPPSLAETWVSTDGIYWAKKDGPPFPTPDFFDARCLHGSVVFLNKPWVYGGVSYDPTYQPVGVSIPGAYWNEAALGSKLRWSITTEVGRTSSSRWKVGVDAVAGVIGLRWNDLTSVAVTSKQRWNVGGTVGRTWKCLWMLPHPIGTAKRLRWKINPLAVGQSVRSRWHVRLNAGYTSHVRWQVGPQCDEVIQFSVTGVAGGRSRTAIGTLFG